MRVVTYHHALQLAVTKTISIDNNYMTTLFSCDSDNFPIRFSHRQLLMLHLTQYLRMIQSYQSPKYAVSAGFELEIKIFVFLLKRNNYRPKLVWQQLCLANMELLDLFPYINNWESLSIRRQWQEILVTYIVFCPKCMNIRI